MYIIIKETVYYVLVCTGVCKYLAWYIHVHVYVVYSEIENGDRFKSLSSPFQDVYIYMYVVLLSSDYVYAALRNCLNNYIVHVHVVHVCIC